MIASESKEVGMTTSEKRASRKPARLRSRSAVVLGLVTLLVCTAGACATVNISKDRDTAYNQAVEAFSSDDHDVAARAAWAYLDGASKDDIRYDRALRLLAQSAETMGLTYVAGLWYLDIAKSKREVELIPIALRGLERIVMGGAHDEETLVKGFLASSEFASMPTDVQSFLDYLQGRDSAAAGLNTWADQRLGRIPQSSPYYHRATYVAIVRAIARGQLVMATKALAQLAKRDKLPKKLRRDVVRSQARLAFESKDFPAAVKYYETLRALAPDEPTLLLEMAWSHYYLGDSRRALGLLLALDAPIYRQLIAPERFLLEALSLRRLCQFNHARRAAVRLQQRHGDALDDLHAGVPLMKSAALRGAARLRGTTRTLAEYRTQLRREAKTVSDLGVGSKLEAVISELYKRGLSEAKRREERDMRAGVRAVAQDLLNSEEGVRLLLHELSVALLRGRRRPAGVREKPLIAVKAGGKRVFYEFQGSFWTDELDDLVVTLSDRCID